MISFLKTFNTEYLENTSLFLCGDAAICLLNSDFRTFSDLNFKCLTKNSYAKLISDLDEDNISHLFLNGATPKLLTSIKGDMHSRYFLVERNGKPLKISLELAFSPMETEQSLQPIQSISPQFLFIEKLESIGDHMCSNALVHNRSLLGRDIIDIIVMQSHWGDIPEELFQDFNNGECYWVAKCYKNALSAMQNDINWLEETMENSGVKDDFKKIIRQNLAKF